MGKTMEQEFKEYYNGCCGSISETYIEICEELEIIDSTGDIAKWTIIK